MDLKDVYVYRDEDEPARDAIEELRLMRLAQPIHCIEEVQGGWQARSLPAYGPDEVVYPVRADHRSAVLDVPYLYESASLDRNLFDEEVARRS